MVFGAERDVVLRVRIGLRRGRADAADRAGEVWTVLFFGDGVLRVRGRGAARGGWTVGAHDERGATAGERGARGDDVDDVARGGVATLVSDDGVLEYFTGGGGGALSGELFPVRESGPQGNAQHRPDDGATGVRGMSARARLRVVRGVVKDECITDVIFIQPYKGRLASPTYRDYRSAHENRSRRRVNEETSARVGRSDR